MNANAAWPSEDSFAAEPLSLTDREIEQLGRLLRDPSTPTAHDLLAFGGVRTAPGLMARLMVADARERSILVTAIRRAIANRDQV